MAQLKTLLRPLVCFVHACEVRMPTSSQQQRLDGAMYGLVSILFAVVFGIGLSEITEVFGIGLPVGGKVPVSTDVLTDGLLLLTAYLTIVLSWWGYHAGIIRGPSESNKLSFAVDALIVVSYWLLINVRNPLWHVLLIYAAVFLLYTFWELIRLALGTWQGAGEAAAVNFFLFALMLLLAVLFCECRDLLAYRGWHVAAFIAGLVILYRFWIGRVYRKHSEAVDSPELLDQCKGGRSADP